MEATQDYTTPIHDNTSRKSLGRRVSFASHSHVRMFEKTDHTNSTGSPQSSPAPVDPPPRPDVTNENDYPRRSLHRRRSSTRYSLARSEDVDLTSVMPGMFRSGGSAILDEDFGDYDDEDYYDNNDMDVTAVMNGDFARKRSLSLGIRQVLAQIPSIPSDDADRSQSDIGDESTQSDVTLEQTQAMEFTVPLGQSLRPADQNQAWLALKQATHSGNNPSEPELTSDDDMSLDDATSRLMRARDFLSLAQPTLEQNDEPQDDSFTSTDNSFEDDGNKTMNSKAFGRVSMTQDDSCLSMGYRDSYMDEPEIYGVIASAKPTPRQSIAPTSVPSTEQHPAQQPPQPPVFSVFRPPPSNEISKQPVNSGSSDKVRVPFSFTPKVVSSKSNFLSADTPSKSKPKPTFSAAFAPPVSRPSPKKGTTMEPHPSPNKRPRSNIVDVENQDLDKPSPFKRQALGGKSSAGPTSNQQLSTHKPKPLSPSKKAPFQLPPPAAPDTTSGPSAASRRPSGYYAKRKSLAVGFIAPSSNTTTTAPVSPKKKPDIGLGRASLGSGPSNAWARFNKDAGQAVATQPPTSKVVEKAADAVSSVREAARQASASPILTRGSPTPIYTLPNSSTPDPQVPFEEPEEPVIEPTQKAEPSDIGEQSSAMEINIDATQQWREGVQQNDQYEEDVVCSKPVFVENILTINL